MLSNIFPGADNLFKYLLTIGVILLFFAIAYPLQKEQELEIEAINLELKAAKLNYDISILDKSVAGYKDVNSNYDTAVLRKYRDQYYDLKRKKIELDYEVTKQITVKRHVLDYTIYKRVFLFSGILLVLLGFRFWLSHTYVEESEKCKNLTPPYQSSFLRIRLRIRRWLRMR